MKELEPILDVARGDIGVSKQVSDALRAISRGSADSALKDQIRDILAGRGSVRDLARNEAFNRLLDSAIPAAMAKNAELSDEERARQVEQGRLELERARRAAESAAGESEASVESATTQPGTAVPPGLPAPSSGRIITGTRKPDRDRVVTPDEPDEDDLFFQERQRRGWLT